MALTSQEAKEQSFSFLFISILYLVKLSIILGAERHFQKCKNPTLLLGTCLGVIFPKMRNKTMVKRNSGVTVSFFFHSYNGNLQDENITTEIVKREMLDSFVEWTISRLSLSFLNFSVL